MLFSVGLAATVKSENVMVSVAVEVWLPAVPVTVRASGFGVELLKLFTVKVEVLPTVTEAGLAVHEALLPLHVRAMLLVKLEGPVTFAVKVTDWEPITAV